MRTLALIIALLPSIASAEWFTSTQANGRVLSTPFREDHNNAVGAVATNAVQPVIVQDVIKDDTPDDDLRREAKTIRTNMTALIQASTSAITNRIWTNTSANAQSAQIEELYRALRDTQREVKDLAGIVRQMNGDPKDD